MKITNNTILITGGATGIGFSLAEAFVKQGNTVIICGRRENKLKEAKEKYPQLHTRVCDISKQQERVDLIKWAFEHFESLNIIINNAGIQQMLNFNSDIDSKQIENEIRTNFEAPVQIASLAISHLKIKIEPAIINVTSGLGFIPLSFVPVYCSTKAALHSFCLSLRHQLKNTSIKVFEIIPPTVDTELDKGARDIRGQTDRGIKPEIVAEETLKAILNDNFECVVGFAQNLITATRGENLQLVFNRMNP